MQVRKRLCVCVCVVKSVANSSFIELDRVTSTNPLITFMKGWSIR